MRGLVVPEPSEDFSADPVELFFDLAYVFALSQLVGLILDEPTWHGIGQATLLFVLLWLPWTQFTWSANAVSSSSRGVRVLFLVATAASVPMAASIPDAFDDAGMLFAVPLAIIYLTAMAMMAIGLDSASNEYRSALRFGLGTTIAMVVIVCGAFADGEARVIIWIIGFLVFFVSTLRAGSDEWIIRTGHFAERHGLIIIIALGEVIVALGTSVAISLSDGGQGFPAPTVVALVASGAFAGMLWWSYFDRVQPAFEHRAESLVGVERGRFARDVYTYAHLPLVAGILLSAVALEELTLHPSEPLPEAFRLMAIAGVTLYLGGVGIGVYRAFGVVAKERLAAVVLIAALLLIGDNVDGAILLIAIDAILLAALVAEHWRIERPVAVAQPTID